MKRVAHMMPKASFVAIGGCGRHPWAENPIECKAALEGDMPFLLRFFFDYRGMSDAEFISIVRGCAR
jgi:hypothetical protein